MEHVWKLFNIRPRKQENEQRVIRIYESKQKLDAARDKYRLAINNRRREARTYAREGHLNLAKNSLMMSAIYSKNLDMVADLLLNVERIMAARERADLLQTTGSVMKDIVVWMKQTVTAMEKENPINDQADDMDEMLRKIDRVQFEMSQATDNGVQQELSADEMAAINDELLDMVEYDDETELTSTEQDKGVYVDVLPRKKHVSSLLADEDSS